MSNNTDPKIQEIKERHARATDGPWRRADGMGEDGGIISEKYGEVISANGDAYATVDMGENDEQFIINSWCDIAYLLSEIERLQTAQDKVKTELEYIAYVCLDKRCIKAAEEALSHLKG